MPVLSHQNTKAVQLSAPVDHTSIISVLFMSRIAADNDVKKPCLISKAGF